MGYNDEAMLSGNAYITAKIRGEDDLIKLKVRQPQNCDHATGGVCETAECLNSWSLDYQFFLQRTNRGRAIIDRFHLSPDMVRKLASDNFRNMRQDIFNPIYDRPVRRAGNGGARND